MAMVKKIKIEVAYATSKQQCIIAIQVDADCTLEEAIDCSGILRVFPEIDLVKQKVGVFGKQRKLTDLLQQDDRIEIYRSLIIDPKEARRKRAKYHI